MSSQARQRLLDLLADQATDALDPRESEEVNELQRLHPDIHPDAMEMSAAAVMLAQPMKVEPLPPLLRARIRASMAVAPSPVVEPMPLRSGLGWGQMGWLAAAAALVVALLGWLRDPELSAAPGPAEGLARLTETAPDLVEIGWSATEDPTAEGASGKVVWSDAADEGYMVFRGLAANDPAVEQYQLWVFDKQRDDRYPVDGGVFDIPPGVDEVIVPIRAKISVEEAALFAITVERPGGVVVSRRERIALLGQVDDS